MRISDWSSDVCSSDLIYTTERTLAEHGDKLDAADRQAVESDLEALKEAVKGDDAADIKEKTEALAQSSMKLGEAAYKAAGQETGEAGAGTEAGTQKPEGERVVDADFEEVDEIGRATVYTHATNANPVGRFLH